MLMVRCDRKLGPASCGAFFGVGGFALVAMRSVRSEQVVRCSPDPKGVLALINFVLVPIFVIRGGLGKGGPIIGLSGVFVEVSQQCAAFPRECLGPGTISLNATAS
jgi:hypothetical protein